jgi:membrane protease YdiL (CAAX protease family)
MKLTNKIKKKSILKNKDKINFEKDVTSVTLPCIIFMYLSLGLAYIFKFLGFDTQNKEFFGTIYLLYCIISIGMIGFINKDYILDRETTRSKITIKCFFAGFTSMIAFMVFFTIPTVMLDIILTPFGYTIESVAPANSSSDSITKFLYVAILGPICEEIIFRGFVQRKLEKYSPVVAITVSALCFALFHGNFSQVFSMIGVGLVLGYMAYKYSIKMSIAMHITHNLVLGELFGLLTDFMEKDGKDWVIPILDISPFIAIIMMLSIIGILVLSHLVITNQFPLQEYRIKFRNLFYCFKSSGMIILLTVSFCSCIEFIEKII